MVKQKVKTLMSNIPTLEEAERLRSFYRTFGQFEGAITIVAPDRNRGYGYRVRNVLSVPHSPTTTAPTRRADVVVPMREAMDEYVATPTEAHLVHDFWYFMEARDVLYAREVTIPAGRIDLLQSTRRLLIEAKADASRNRVRYAIGQLADYAVHFPSYATAVLAPERPEADLERVLLSKGIASIWRNGLGFVDNCYGKFTA